MLDLLDELHDSGRTIVLITHEPDVAARAGRVVQIRDGRRERSARGGARMNWRDTLRTAGDAVRTHRLRSALTMLGILIGITAVILTVGLGNGARADVRDQINELGTNLLVVSPGSSTDELRRPRRLRVVVDAHRSRTPRRWPTRSSPPTSRRSPRPRPDRCRSTAGETNWTTTLTGTTRRGRTSASRSTSSGRFLTDEDEDDAAAVVLGPDTATELFFGGNPVGQTVTYDGTELEVVGVLDALSSSDDTSNNDVAIVPLLHLLPAPRRRDDRDSVSSIYVKAVRRRHPVGRLPGGRRDPAATCTASPPPTTPTSRSPPRSRS